MIDKHSVELVGASDKSINDALLHALADLKETEPDYEVLETLSNDINGKKSYQITIKVNLPPSEATC